MADSKPKLLVFVVAYEAEASIASVIRRIPLSLLDTFEVEILIIDDASKDGTFDRSYELSKASELQIPIKVLFNPVNQGYGGNQKLGYHYAIRGGFDYVVLVHGDGQYAPECIPALLEPLRRSEASAVFGSRMMLPGDALKGGMPLYKFIGNKLITWAQNKILRCSLSEFHSGFRAYALSALRSIPFERNSNGFDFDTEIIIQLLIARHAIKEIPIPTHYGDEICRVDGVRYALAVVLAALKARLQEMSLFYDRRFDCAPVGMYSPYTLKLGYESPHTLTLKRVPPGARVLDLGCAGGYMAAVLKRQKGCFVSAVDISGISEQGLDESRILDLNAGLSGINTHGFDAVLLLDVVEHLARPEAFLEELRLALGSSTSTEVIISTGNIGFIVTRAMLLAGQFNYGKRGILDLTHTRLFTFCSLKRAVAQAGFDVLEVRGIPAPLPLAIGDNIASRALMAINALLIRFSRGLFSYQIFMRLRARPTVDALLDKAAEQSRARIAGLETSGWASR